MVDRQTAVIGTSAALCHRCPVFQRFDIFDGEHGSTFAFHIAFPCDQGSTERSHDAGNVRADCVAACNFLKTSKNSIIIESTALHNNVLSQF